MKLHTAAASENIRREPSVRAVRSCSQKRSVHGREPGLADSAQPRSGPRRRSATRRSVDLTILRPIESGSPDSAPVFDYDGVGSRPLGPGGGTTSMRRGATRCEPTTHRERGYKTATGAHQPSKMARTRVVGCADRANRQSSRRLAPAFADRYSASADSYSRAGSVQWSLGCTVHDLEDGSASISSARRSTRAAADLRTDLPDPVIANPSSVLRASPEPSSFWRALSISSSVIHHPVDVVRLIEHVLQVGSSSALLAMHSSSTTSTLFQSSVTVAACPSLPNRHKE